MDKPSPISLFISYSHTDESLKEQLVKHLAGLKRSGIVSEWHDRKLAAGQVWDGTIREELRTAQIILLLVSSDFLSSDYCNDVEIREAMRRHEEGQAVVIPIILRPCDWKAMPFGTLQALPTDAAPLTKWQSMDDGFLNVVEGIRDVIGSLHEGSEKDVADQDGSRERTEAGFFAKLFGATSQRNSLKKHRWTISFGLTFAAVVAVAILILNPVRLDNSLPGEPAMVGDSTGLFPPDPHQKVDPPKPKTYCKVTFLIPSDLNDAEVFVDGKLAGVIERKPTAFVVRMEKRATGQRVVLRNNFRECSTYIIVDGDKEVVPCQ